MSQQLYLEDGNLSNLNFVLIGAVIQIKSHGAMDILKGSTENL